MKFPVCLVAAALLALGPATPAAAFCIPDPVESPNKFTGTVVETANDHRTATVRTDDGRTVTVNGTEGGPGSFTSVDRTYEQGARYEFHPINAADPYQDNACTATRVIGPAAAGQGDELVPISGPAAEEEDDISLGWMAFGGLVGAALLALGVVTTRRRGGS